MFSPRRSAERSRRTGAFATGDEYHQQVRLDRDFWVVTLEDGETVHNAFFDRNFREGEP